VTPPLSVHAWLRYDAIEQHLRRAPNVRTVLELGAGQGSVGVLLARRYDYLGLEPDAASYETARQRFARAGVREIVQGDASELERGRAFDLVCAFEVLEHLEDDTGALAGWADLVTPGGSLLVSVPAGRDRFGASDVKAGHVRRYDAADLERLFKAADLVETSITSYGFPAGYALEAGRNLVARRLDSGASLEERTAASGRWLQPPGWAAPATLALAWPFRLLQRP
jgi:2-polyprenyl-3-methyl-5-hydroxy-6-metoxy-1,4-benzoquinol methylase